MHSDYRINARSCFPYNSWHLYGFSRPVNLNERCDLVDIAVIVFFALSVQILSNIFHVKGPLAYVGGKNRIANQIIEVFPEHKTYVELFAGGAQVLFHKKPSAVEVLNDLDRDVVTFFRVAQSHYQALVDYLRFVVASRVWFGRLQTQDPSTLTDIQRAARFFYLQKNAYGGLVRRRVFGYVVAERSRFNPERIPELIEETHKRLARVQIEQLPYQEVLVRYDRSGSLFYADPPYFKRTLYNHNFSESDFVELAERLESLQGKFVLSLNDVPEVRRIFRRFCIREIQFSYTVQQTAGKRFRELLITNFEPRNANSEPQP